MLFWDPVISPYSTCYQKKKKEEEEEERKILRPMDNWNSVVMTWSRNVPQNFCFCCTSTYDSNIPASILHIP
jgi:hypothetical protein